MFDCSVLVVPVTSHAPIRTIPVGVFLFIFWMRSNEKFLLLTREMSLNRLALRALYFWDVLPFPSRCRYLLRYSERGRWYFVITCSYWHSEQGGQCLISLVARISLNNFIEMNQCSYFFFFFFSPKNSLYVLNAESTFN